MVAWLMEEVARLRAGNAEVVTGKFRMSKRSVQDLLAGFCGVKVGLGSIRKMEQTVSAAAAPAVEVAGAPTSPSGSSARTSLA